VPQDRLSVLVVEDDPVARRIVRDLVAKRGHEVEACSDGESAWGVAQAMSFDLAVLDMHLPGMEGDELCRRLRNLPGADDLVVVFVTGADRPEDLQNALEAGADDFILKPVDYANVPVRLALAERLVHFRKDRRRSEEALLQNALRDGVTDLANRTLFVERLHRTSRRAARENKKGKRSTKYLYSVMHLNLDGFGRVNARLGYKAGNQILQEVGRRLEDCVRGVDTVSRNENDEFLILLDDMNDVSDPNRVAQRIEQAFAKPIDIDGEDIRLSACIGVALNLGGPPDPQQLLADAKTALARAKQSGPGSYEMFDAVVHARAAARLSLEAQLRAAVSGGQMTLHYQPIVSLETGETLGLEALARWNEPQRGLVMPGDFIQVAEDTGVINDLSRWALGEALQQLGIWQRELNRPDLFVSVNVSGRSFNKRGSVELISDALSNSGLADGSLHVEITETALMTDLDATARALVLLRDASIRVHADDFGTGYSSLSYLCRLPIDSLKIDRSFVSRLTHSSENLEVVRTITRLAENLGLTVVAEGIETERQLEELGGLGCQFGQGYLFARPRAAPEIAEFLGTGSVAAPG